MLCQGFAFLRSFVELGPCFGIDGKRTSGGSSAAHLSRIPAPIWTDLGRDQLCSRQIRDLWFDQILIELAFWTKSDHFMVRSQPSLAKMIQIIRNGMLDCLLAFYGSDLKIFFPFWIFSIFSLCPSPIGWTPTLWTATITSAVNPRGSVKMQQCWSVSGFLIWIPWSSINQSILLPISTIFKDSFWPRWLPSSEALCPRTSSSAVPFFSPILIF